MVQGWNDYVETEYAVKAEQGKNVTVVLNPRSEKLAAILSSLTFTMQPKTFRVKKLKFEEGNGDDIEIVFLNEKENEVLDPSLFSLQNPGGFEIEISR